MSLSPPGSRPPRLSRARMRSRATVKPSPGLGSSYAPGNSQAVGIEPPLPPLMRPRTPRQDLDLLNQKLDYLVLPVHAGRLPDLAHHPRLGELDSDVRRWYWLRTVMAASTWASATVLARANCSRVRKREA